MKNDFVRLTVILFLICAVGTGALAYVNTLTAGPIAAINEKIAAEARIAVMPPDANSGSYTTEELAKPSVDEIEDVYAVNNGGTLIGYAFTVTVKGYGGDLKLMVGITPDGKVSGVTIMEHSETPGLGAKSTDPAWIAQYTGLSATQPITVTKAPTVAGNQVKAITAATITSNAVTAGVNLATGAYVQIQGGN